jgi:PAS domain S-box-containing protein
MSPLSTRTLLIRAILATVTLSITVSTLLLLGVHDRGLYPAIAAALLVALLGVAVLLAWVTVFRPLFSRYQSDIQTLEMLSLVVRHTDSAVVVTDPRGQITWVNPAFTRLTGYMLKEALGLTPGQLLQGEGTNQATVARLGEAVRKGMPAAAEILNYSKSGRPYWVSLSLNPVRDAAGVIRYYVGVQQDVTARREVEAALHVSEERYRLLVDSLVEGVVMQDAQGNIEACNASAERILGLSADQLQGRTSLDPRWRSVHEDGSPFPGEQHPAMVALRTGEAQRDVLMGVQKPDGALTWIAISAQPLIAPGALRPHAVVTSFFDITARRQVEQVKGELISVTSHELRTPLTAINGALLLIASGATGDLAQPTRQMVEVALRNAERMIRLVDDLLDVDRIEAGRAAIRPQAVAFTRLIQHALELNRPYAEQLHVALKVDGSIPDGWVAVDFDRMQQALSNLIGNAIKFSAAGSAVLVGAERAADSARIWVRDAGIGIPAELQGQIFEKFSQADGPAARRHGARPADREGDRRAARGPDPRGEPPRRWLDLRDRAAAHPPARIAP